MVSLPLLRNAASRQSSLNSGSVIRVRRVESLPSRPAAGMIFIGMSKLCFCITIVNPPLPRSRWQQESGPASAHGPRCHVPSSRGASCSTRIDDDDRPNSLPFPSPGQIDARRLGVKAVDDGTCLVSFMHDDLGYIDLEQDRKSTRLNSSH